MGGRAAASGARRERGERLARGERPTFYFDFSSPECWLAAERVNHELPAVPEWIPVRVRQPGGRVRRPLDASELADLERRAAAQGLPAPRLPDPWPEDLDLVLRAATFAAASGRVVAFSLAALRQAFAAGRDLSQIDHVLIAAAACELHPRAVLKGIESRSVEERLRRASARAEASAVSGVPAVVAGETVFVGTAGLEDAADALGRRSFSQGVATYAGGSGAAGAQGIEYSASRMAKAKAREEEQQAADSSDGATAPGAEDRSPDERLPSEPGEHHELPDRETCEHILREMLLIRRFEERAGEMYTKAAIGGFLHLAIGEEAAVVGAALAMRKSDYLISTYREHGQALVRGTDPNRVMAELFGRQGGVSKGHGGSMHLFDVEKRLMGGYGIVGSNMPLAVGLALASDYLETEDVTVCMLGDGAVNQGNFGEALNLAALWDLPVVFMVINNQFGMGTALERHSAITDLSKRGDGYGVPGARCNGMDVLDTHAELERAVKAAREDRVPQLVEAVTYRFRGHSMADPEEYRSKEEVEEWQRRDPITTFRERVVDGGLLSGEDVEKLDEEAQARVEEAVEFATNSPYPELDALYDDLYVYGDQVPGWYVVDERAPETHKGEELKESASTAMQELAEAGAAYANVGDAEERRKRPDPEEGEEESSGPREEEGGAD